MATTQAGTDPLAQDANSDIGKLLVSGISSKTVFASGVHDVGGASYYTDRNGLVRLAITDRGTLNDELDSVVVDPTVLDLGWPNKDGDQIIQSGASSGLLVNPLLSLPRNPTAGHVLASSVIIGSSVVLAYEDGSFYTVPTVALTSAAPLPASVLVDRTAEFAPSGGQFGKIAFVRAAANGIYVMTASGSLYLISIPSGAL